MLTQKCRVGLGKKKDYETFIVRDIQQHHAFNFQNRMSFRCSPDVLQYSYVRRYRFGLQSAYTLPDCTTNKLIVQPEM